VRRNSDEERKFEPSEQQGKSGKRHNAAPRTLGDLLTLNNCKIEQVLRHCIRKEFAERGRQRHHKCLTQGGRGC
jgi:hypothetical protein